MPTKIKRPKVSIIIPCCNVGTYLRECVKSIRSQTLKDIEIWIVDDNSDDESISYIDDIIDDRFKIIRNERRLGAGLSRNKAMKVSTGEFIAFIDGDDFYPSSHVLEFLYHLAKKNKADICGGSLFICNEFGEVISQKIPGQFFETTGFLNYQDYQYDGGFYRFIYARSFILENNLSFPDYLRMQDPVFFVNAMCVANRIFVTSKYTYAYRKNHKKIDWTERRVKDHLRAINDILIISKHRNLNRLHLLMGLNFIKTIRTKPLSVHSHAIPVFNILKEISFRHVYLGYKEKTGKGGFSFFVQLLKIIKKAKF